MSARDEEVKQAMGEWLGTLAPWDVFSTWTFSRPVQVWGAMHWARRHLRVLEDMSNGWALQARSRKNAWGYLPDAQLSVPRKRLYAFVGVERGDRGHLLHLHALVGNVGDLSPYCGTRLAPGEWGQNRDCCMLHAWPCGYARVLPYDPSLGAAHYVSKYVVKKLSEWDLVGFPLDGESNPNVGS